MITRRGLAATRVVVAGALMATALIVIEPPAVRADPLSGEVRPIKAVVLVDESGSLTGEGVVAEREAASIIVQSEFSPASEVSVVGFGSDNGVTSRSGIDTVCPPTKVDSDVKRNFLAKCVQELHVRTAEEGNYTDFVIALQQALNLLGKGDGTEAKIIFLLTDGELDVSDSPRYGAREERNATARRMMNEQLAIANARGVGVWPLGFGPQINREQLEDFAARSSPRRCNPGSPAPRARVTASPGDVVPSVLEAFAAARCAKVDPPQSSSLPSGATVEIPVVIPAIATDGSITVIKRDGRIAVDYFDPAGTRVPKGGDLGESSFQVSGESSTVEVLRIRNPRPGRWTVRLRSSPSVAAQEVSATVIWQGVVNAAIALDPPQMTAGKEALVHVTILTRNGAVDPGSLGQLRVGAQLSGEGFDPIDIALHDDGRDGDSKGEDGRFTGRVTIPPAAKGTLRFVGTVAGEGIMAEQRPAHAVVDTLPPPVRVDISLPSGDRVSPGGTLPGRLKVENSSGKPLRLRLVLVEADAGTLARISPPVTTVSAGSGGSEIPIELTVDNASRRGPAQVTVRVVDDADPAKVYSETLLPLVVDWPPPPLVRRLLWLWMTIAAMVTATALLVMALRTRSRAARRDVRGLVVLLLEGDRQVGFVHAPDLPAKEFRFVVRDEPPGSFRLDLAEPGEPAYLASRRSDGTPQIRSPGGTQTVMSRGRRVELSDGKLSLRVRDDREDYTEVDGGVPDSSYARSGASTPTPSGGYRAAAGADPAARAGESSHDNDPLLW